MRSHPAGIALLALLLCACSGLGDGAAPPSEETSRAPVPTQAGPAPTTPAPTTPAPTTPAPTVPAETASVTPSPEPAPGRPDGFELAVSDIRLDDLDDSVITGAPGTPVVDAAGLAAVRRAAAVLERYLDRAFVDPRSRFTAAPADDLLTLGALSRLTPAAKAGLGAIDLQVRVSAPGPASAHARAVIQGETVLHVALDYQAQLSVRLADGRAGPVRQRGTLVFVTTPAGSRADFAEVHLAVPWDSPETPDAPETPAPAPDEPA